ncbi:MAG: flagellar export chaperone FliS [Kofleriaceae bacterium]
MHARAAHAYRQVDLASAPKSQVLDRLFERFLQDLDTARAALARRDIAGKASALDHALRIVGELAAALDHDAAPELCANLAALYDFVGHCVTQANIALATEPLDRATRIMSELAASFREAHAR